MTSPLSDSDERAASSVRSLPYAFGGPLAHGTIRQSPEDFVVVEVLGFEASGAGEHFLLTVRKRDANTKFVAKQLAARIGVRVREVGYAGLKDRHAVTEQSFTVPALKMQPEDWRGFAGAEFEVVGAEFQRRKLRIGAHRGNRFKLTVRNFHVDPNALRERLELIAVHGVPNYFGEQRFGHNDGNLAVAQRWLCEGHAPVDRDQRSFALSAARSALFNEVLSARVSQASWERLLPGEVVNLEGTGSIFVPEEITEDLIARCVEMDVHPTGPLCGSGESRTTAVVHALEADALSPWKQWIEALVALRVEQQRRPLRIAVRNLEWQYQDDVLRLQFELGKGAFATAVLREIADAGRAAGL